MLAEFDTSAFHYFLLKYVLNISRSEGIKSHPYGSHLDIILSVLPATELRFFLYGRTKVINTRCPHLTQMLRG